MMSCAERLCDTDKTGECDSQHRGEENDWKTWTQVVVIDPIQGMQADGVLVYGLLIPVSVLDVHYIIP